MNGNSQESGRQPSVGAPTVGPTYWHERLLAVLACGSESNPRQLNALLRTGLGVGYFFEIATWLEVTRLEPAMRSTEWPFFIFDVALVSAVFSLTYFKWFSSNWRAVAMAFCLVLIASSTLSTLAVNKDEPLLRALFVLALGTAVLVPWSARWQGALTMAGLIAFAVVAADGVVEPPGLHRWLVLAAVGAFALSFTALKDHYRAQTNLIDALLDKEKRLAKSEAMLRTLFDAVPDIVTLTRFSDGKLFEVNEEFLKRSGLSREQALGTSIVEIAAWRSPQVRAGFIAELKHKGHVRNYETNFRLQELVAPYLLSSVVVEIDGELYALNVARDATQIKENERALREAQERLRAQVEELTATEARLRVEVADRRQAQARATMMRGIFDTTSDIIIVRRANGGGGVEVNDEFVKRTGISRAQALGSSMDEMPLYLRTEDRAEFLRRIRTEGMIKDFEADFILKGEVVPYLISGAVVESEDGPFIFGVSRDISARKQMERELVAAREKALDASRAKSEFLSSMSHEIRTPMNAILGMADLLSDGPLGADQRRYVDTMRSNGNALLHLINDILDVAKIESGRLSLESVSFDLEDAVDKAIETMSVRAHAKGLELMARILPHVPLNLIGDPLRLRQILVNLAANAIKFTEKGEVALTVESLSPAEALCLGFSTDSADGGDGKAKAPVAWLRFSVADTGIGIAADQLGAIFSGFTQADPSISRRFGGSGLGLTIVRRLSEMMGGRVEVESQLGRGSIFRVTVAFGVDTRPVAAQARGADVRLDGVRILVVDDNETNRLILREMLVRNRAEVTEAASGAAALAELARAHAAGCPYRLMLLDYRMPGMDGVEVARKAIDDGFARASPGGQDTIILMLTSDDLNFRLARMREAGLHTYLIKPVKRAELLEQIGLLLNGIAAGHSLAEPAEPASTPDDTPPLRILLAEDAPDNRFLIQAYLKKLPYRIDIAENGRVAIKKFKASRPDLVLMDVQMPDIDGLAATRVIRQWESEQGLPATPIIALTASALEDDVRRTLAAGCDEHVSKPVKRPILLAAIRRVVAMRPVAAAAKPQQAAAANPESPREADVADTPLA